jgi:hypothetical protein
MNVDTELGTRMRSGSGRRGGIYGRRTEGGDLQGW